MYNAISKRAINPYSQMHAQNCEISIFAFLLTVKLNCQGDLLNVSKPFLCTLTSMLGFLRVLCALT